MKNTSQLFEFYLMFLIFSTHKKIREQKFESTHFSFRDETYGDVTIKVGAFLTPWLFKG
jgi:hypothetical protein